MAVLSLHVGQSKQLQVLQQSLAGDGPAVNADVSWTSSDESVATVYASSVMGGSGSNSSAAIVTGVGYGEAVVTATVDDSSADFPVTVAGDSNDGLVIVHVN